KQPHNVQIDNLTSDLSLSSNAAATPTAAAAAAVTTAAASGNQASSAFTYSIFSLIPKAQHARATNIKHFLERSGAISWNEVNGEVIINGELLEGAHIVELISDVIKALSPRPRGWEIFAKFLWSINMPMMLI